MTCRSNYDISLKRWRCCGNFCSSMHWKCCSICPESKLWSCCTFDKINSRDELFVNDQHSAMIPTVCCAPAKTITIWCDIKHVEVRVQQQADVSCLSWWRDMSESRIITCTSKTFFECNDVRWYYLASTLSYWWKQMVLFSISKSTSSDSLLLFVFVLAMIVLFSSNVIWVEFTFFVKFFFSN